MIPAALAGWPDWLLGGLLIAGAATDLARGLIYNWLTLPAMILGLGLGFLTQGGWGGLWALAGLVLGGGLLILPFWLGGVGGGDVKLLAAVGALTGPLFVLKAAVYSCLIGGLVALGLLAAHGLLGQGLMAVGRFWRSLLWPGLAVEKPEALKVRAVPFGACIALGAAVARWWDFLPGLFRP